MTGNPARQLPATSEAAILECARSAAQHFPVQVPSAMNRSPVLLRTRFSLRLRCCTLRFASGLLFGRNTQYCRDFALFERHHPRTDILENAYEYPGTPGTPPGHTLR